jgi:hypothetical protein
MIGSECAKLFPLSSRGCPLGQKEDFTNVAVSRIFVGFIYYLWHSRISNIYHFLLTRSDWEGVINVVDLSDILWDVQKIKVCWDCIVTVRRITVGQGKIANVAIQVH